MCPFLLSTTAKDQSGGGAGRTDANPGWNTPEWSGVHTQWVLPPNTVALLTTQILMGAATPTTLTNMNKRGVAGRHTCDQTKCSKLHKPTSRGGKYEPNCSQLSWIAPILHNFPIDCDYSIVIYFWLLPGFTQKFLMGRGGTIICMSGGGNQNVGLLCKIDVPFF